MFVNGHRAENRRGGYDPFSFDIGARLNPKGEHEIVVKVFDPTEGGQPRGKQSRHPGGIFLHAIVEDLADGMGGTGAAEQHRGFVHYAGRG